MSGPWYQDDSVTVWHGDCLDVLCTFPDNSVDAVVTDPPYGLEFMGKDWDAPWRQEARAGSAVVVRAEQVGGFQDGNGGNAFSRSRIRTDTRRHGGDMTRANRGYQAWCERWATQCQRVLKPGGMIVAFGGTRTFHRLACAIEDAGFEIRDSIAWLYASGFPKSLDVSKAIDRARRDESDWARVGQWLKTSREAAGYTRQSLAPLLTGHKNLDSAAANVSNWENGLSFPTWERWEELRTLLHFGDEMDAEVWRLNGRKGAPGEAWEQRPVTGQHAQPDPRLTTWADMQGNPRGTAKERRDIPATDAARRWQGWGTALKPAHEPIVVARKPLAGTVASNVQQWGTGALNIDGCRVGTDDTRRPETTLTSKGLPGGGFGHPEAVREVNGRVNGSEAGRWPPNVLLDPATAAELDRQSGTLTSGYMRPEVDRTTRQGAAYGEFSARTAAETYGDSGGASRFFPVFKFEPKAPTHERPRDDTAAHPTVKPLDLMRWLVRLVCPPGGLVLDPFAGSGTTAEACVVEGFRCVTIEREPTYLPLIRARLTKPIALDLFGGLS